MIEMIEAVGRFQKIQLFNTFPVAVLYQHFFGLTYSLRLFTIFIYFPNCQVSIGVTARPITHKENKVKVCILPMTTTRRKFLR